MQAPLAIVADPVGIRFPAYCVECGAPPAQTFKLSGRRRDAIAIHVPVCDRCGERKGLYQALWVLGSIAIAVGVAVALAVASDAAIAAVPGLRALVLPVLMVIGVLSGLVVWVATRAGRRAFHRRFSAVWLDHVAPTRVSLRVRRADLHRDIAALSGAPSSLEQDSVAAYRGIAAVKPAAFDGARRPKPAGWFLVLFGLAICAVGIEEYVSLGAAEAKREVIRRNWLEIVIYQLGGRTAVLVLFLAFGLAAVVAGVQIWRRAQHRPMHATGDRPG